MLLKLLLDCSTSNNTVQYQWGLVIAYRVDCLDLVVLTTRHSSSHLPPLRARGLVARVPVPNAQMQQMWHRALWAVRFGSARDTLTNAAIGYADRDCG